MRLIDADALREKAFGKRGGLIHASDIDSAPTVWPKHGKWIDDNCSECGVYVYKGDVRNYCPNCGAQMDGGETE